MMEVIMSRIGDMYVMAVSRGSAGISNPHTASVGLSAAAYRSLGAVGNLFARIRDAVRTQQLKRQAIRELLALDDRMLRDVGLHRGEIHALVAGMLSVEELEANRIKPVRLTKQPDSVTCGRVLGSEWVDGDDRAPMGHEPAANDARSSIAA